MKGYKVVLPPKEANDGYVVGQDIKLYTPEGHEVTRLGDFEIDVSVGKHAMITLSLPIGEIVHAEPEGEQVSGDNETIEKIKNGETVYPKYREYGDLS